MLVVTLGGSPSQRSRSGVLLDHAKRWLNQQGVEVVSYQVRDFPAEDLLHARFDSPKIIDLLQQIENADGLVLATPVYKASFSGALKTVLVGQHDPGNYEMVIQYPHRALVAPRVKATVEYLLEAFHQNASLHFPVDRLADYTASPLPSPASGK